MVPPFDPCRARHTGRFLSALCCIASRKDLIRNLFASTEYASQGIYTIRFFKNGHWKHITIDDRIPCNVTPATCALPMLTRPT
jgi:hypothetical protein